MRGAPRQQAVILKDEGALALEPDLTFRLEQPRDDSEQRAFAAAARADHRDELAALHAQRHFIQHAPPVKVHADALQINDRL